MNTILYTWHRNIRHFYFIVLATYRTGRGLKEEVVMDNITVVAEIGCNHLGRMDIAKEMIMTAALFCKVDAVKFQKRNVRESLTEEQYKAPHPNQCHAFGTSYGEHREFLEFDLTKHRQLKEWCDQFGIKYSSSVWDFTSAKEIASLEPSWIKIPSACNLHWAMLGYLCDEYGGEIHLSVGMTTREEIEQIVQFFESKKRNKDLVMYACTSGYPVAFEDVCLLELVRLKDEYSSRVKGFGFSGHHLGIAVDVAALTLGATVFERHFTLDRTWKGTDHAASLEPDGMRRLVRDLDNVKLALGYKATDLLAVEQIQRKKLKWSGT
jgi:N-acetylneuraminate synthase